MDKIRGFHPPYAWMKTFVLLHILTLSTTSALFFGRLLRGTPTSSGRAAYLALTPEGLEKAAEI